MTNRHNVDKSCQLPTRVALAGLLRRRVSSLALPLTSLSPCSLCNRPSEAQADGYHLPRPIRGMETCIASL